MESIETRNRYYPAPGVNSEEVDKFWESHLELVEISEKLEIFVTPISDTYTDYGVVGK